MRRKLRQEDKTLSIISQVFTFLVATAGLTIAIIGLVTANDDTISGESASRFAGPVSGLVGFFNDPGSVTFGFPRSYYALYDGDTGLQLTDALQPVMAYLDTNQPTLGKGRNASTWVSIYEDQTSTPVLYLATFDTISKDTAFLELVYNPGNADRVVASWEPNSQKYYMATNQGSEAVILSTIDTSTGVITRLSPPLSPLGGSAVIWAMEHLGDSTLVLAKRGILDLWQFNRTSGDRISTTSLTPVFNYLGDEWPGLKNVDPDFRGMTYDPVQNRMYFIVVENGPQRYLGYMEGTSEQHIVDQMVNGTFTMNLLPRVLFRTLNSILWMS